MSLYMSVSSIEDFMTCRRLYWYKRIKKYDRIVFDIPFLVGRTVHIGMAHLLGKKKDAMSLTQKYFKNEHQVMNKKFTLTEEQKEELNEQEFIIKAMLLSYQKKYGIMLRDSKLLDSEVEGAVDVGNDVVFVFKLDNLLLIRKKKVLHELKTSKYITPDYIKSIQTDMQTAAYYYLYNIVYEKGKIDEIMYDIVRKPSIRQKKAETYQAYLTRLQEWYEKPEDMSVFHIERFEKPVIAEDDFFNTISKVSQEMLSCKEKEDYYQDYEKCHGYYGKRCPYYELCHEGGETKENLLLYDLRKPYKVDKSNLVRKE